MKKLTDGKDNLVRKTERLRELGAKASKKIILNYLIDQNKNMEKDVNSLDKINVVGDRVLVKPRKESERSESGLYLPPGVKEKEKIQYGYIVKSGPGYPIPLPMDNDEPWKSEDEKVKYVPLQVKEGDLAVFLQGGAYEVMYQGEKYFIVPQSSILMIERDESLFN